MNIVGKQLVFFGLIIIITGLILIYREQLPLLKKLGHLPGDIVIKKENFSFYFPLMTSLIVSLILSFLFFLFRK